MIAHYEDTKSNTFFRATPQQLERVKGLCDILESKIMATRKSTPHNYKDGSVVSPSLPQPTRVTKQKLEEKREKGLCYNCDSKCTKGHKCAEKKLFYIEHEEEKEKDQETSKEEDIRQDPTPEKEEMNQTISCKPLARMTTPQTLKTEGHIKKKKVKEVKDHVKKEEMNPTISCNSLVGITTPQTIKLEGHTKKKNVQEVKDHIERQEMNPTISCKGLEEITTPQTLKIEEHIKKKKVQAVKDHIDHQQQVLQLLKDNATLVQNQMKQQEMLAILHALNKWRPYRMGRLFKDEDVEALFCAISIIQPDWINEARDEWKKDKEVWPLIQKLQKIPMQTILLEIEEEGKIILEPGVVTEIRTRKLRNRSISEYLIKWKNLPAEDSTWEDNNFIQKHQELLKH